MKVIVEREANNQVVAHEDLMGSYFPRASGFSRTNLRKKQEQKDAILADPTIPHPPTIEAPP